MAKKNEYGVSLEDVVSELQQQVEDGVNFIFSEFEQDWEKAERYYAGQTDLPTAEGRSKVVKTVVRDSIRAVRPSVMRTLLQARKIVEYIPTSPQYAAWADQQSEFVGQLFWQNDGYRQILSAFDTAAKLKIGPMKVYWKENPKSEYFERRYVPQQLLDQLLDDPNIQIMDVEIEEDAKDAFPGVTLFNVQGYNVNVAGKLCIEAVPNYEFFVDRNASSVQDAEDNYCLGQRRLVTVAEAMELGLEHDDWERLDYEDPEQSEHTNSSYYRRRYQKDAANSNPSDLTQHEFLLTEVYRRADLEGTGASKLYVFWLGGTSYEYLHHEEVEFSPFEVVCIDPQPFTVVGQSIADLTTEEQDMNTSILRAIADNFHMSNNPRLGGDPKRVTFDDLVNPQVGAPFRVRGDYQVQQVTIPFTGQNGLPLLGYLDRDIEEKIGYTKAATGLDPDALQSTDKDAVRNTIQLSQGQIEFMVRNVVETCLIPLFRKMLKLVVAYGEPIQMMHSKGSLMPLPAGVLNPDLSAYPTVGLGAGSPELQGAGLQMIIQDQMQAFQQYGLNNPICTMAQHYSAKEDLAALMGVQNYGKYMNVITPSQEQQMAGQQAQAQEEAAKNQPPQPHEVLAQIEAQKLELEQKKAILAHREKQIQNQLEALKEAERLDLQRDKMVQERQLKLIELNSQQEADAIRAEQKANDADRITSQGA